MILTKFHILARLLLLLLTVKTIRSQDDMWFQPQENEVKAFEDKAAAALGTRTRFIFYDKK